MSFTITLDYRFDSSGFFNAPDRRAALEQAVSIWEDIILDEFDDLPVGTSFTIRNPSTLGSETVTLTNAVDDLVIFVGARNFPGSTLAIAGPDGVDAAGDVYAARISADFRNTGPVTDFEPWAGSISFDSDTNWSFNLGAPGFGKSDFLSVAVHEIGHVLGFGTSETFERWMTNATLTGPNARSVNNGQAIPLESDGGHVREGFAGNSVSLDPTLTNGERVLVSDYDKAILADIGYEIAGFSKQGSTPAIATSAGERIFGRDVSDTIDGLAGNDSIQGAGGDDHLIGNSGDDDLFGQAGNDTLLGGAGDDYLGGGDGDDVLQGGGGRDSYYGGGGTDVFIIGKGDGQNIISDFDAGTEVIRLIDSGFGSAVEAAASVSKVASNLSRLTLGDGTTVDVFHASQSGSPLKASNFELLDGGSSGVIRTINGNAGANRLQGDERNEQINGHGGNDTLSGGGGNDTLSGGSGADTFDINPGDQRVEITDFDLFQDILDLRDFDRAEVATALQDAHTDKGVVLTFLDGTTITVGGTYVTTAQFNTASVQASGSNHAPVGPLVILGDAVIGNTLTARPNGIKDDDGINYSTQAFQWLRDGNPIPGATSQTYLVSSADAGAQISIRYTYTDMLGTHEQVESKPEPAVPTTGGSDPVPPGDIPPDPGTYNPNNKEPTGTLVILGDALVGETLTARSNGVSDPDGINTATKSYQWLRDGEPISGQTGQTYLVSSADRGTQISVQFTFLDQLGTRETVTSKPEPAVPGSGTTDIPDNNDDVDPPIVPRDPDGHVNSGPVGKVIILGFPVEDAELLARTDAIFDQDGIDRSKGTFQWFRDGEPIAGATGQIYKITADDRGGSLTVQFTYTDGHGTVEKLISDPEPPVPFPAGQGPTVDDDKPDEVSNDGILTGTSANDSLTATASLQRIDGLAGDDTAYFAGDQTDFVVTLGRDGVSVTNRADDGFGTIALDNVERIDFGTDLAVFGGPMDLNLYGGHTGLDAATFESFVEMYIAYFNRAPDAVGLAFWGTAFANGMSLEDIAAEFATQPETLATYPAGSSNIKFAADVYENVLGRSPDIDGLRFWTDALDKGAVSRGEFILEVLQGAKAAPAPGATQAFVDRQIADQHYLEQKTDLGALFAVHRGMSNVDDAAQVLALFDGSAGSLQSAVDAIETLYTAAMDDVNGDFLMPLVGVIDDPFAV